MSIILKSGASGNLATIDSLGNLYVATTPNLIPLTAAPWNSGTVLNTTQILNTSGGYPSILVQFDQGSTITGGVATFEGTYDGINWETYPASQVIDPVTFISVGSTYTFVPSTNQAILLVTAGFQQSRIRLSTVISGSGTVTLYWNLLAHNPQQDAGIVAVSNFPTQPSTFKTIQVTAAGNTAIWTPASGKKFRLLKYQVEGTLNVAQNAQGVLTISFEDASTPMPFAHDVYVPSNSLKYSVIYRSGWIDLGSVGYLSSTINNALNVNLSSALTQGNFRVIVCGTEQ